MREFGISGIAVARRVISMVLLVTMLLATGCARRPEKKDATASGPRSEVVVLGAIHGRHRTSQSWGIDQFRQVVRRIHPDAVLCEIPPDRWPAAWRLYRDKGVVEDDRIRRFPEYTDMLLPMAAEMGFEIVPCAAWTREMADERRERLRVFETDPRYAEQYAAYEKEDEEIEARYPDSLDDVDDPWVLHSKEYDRRTKEALGPYDRYLNDFIGAGGWTNINRAHMKLIDAAIAARPGRRLLIIFGAGHKYWFLERLEKNPAVTLLDPTRFLDPSGSPPAPTR